MTIIMKKLQLEHCTGRFYEDEVDEVSDQKDGFESKSEFMVLNTHSLTTKNGSSRDISPPPSLGKVLFRKAQSHRNSRDILHLQKSTAFQLGPVSLRVGVCQTAVAAALRSTLLTEVFLAIS